MSRRLPAVFSGAGLSGAAPASMPLGYALRDRVLDLMFHHAHVYAAGLVTVEQRDALRAPERKLEQVLGRLWRIVGEDAMDCLACLRPAAPNEAHCLAAVHLARGGTHVTLNFDRGIEDAYALLGRGAPALRTVTTRRQFDHWVRDGKPPALLKVHGGLGADGQTRLDVVVEDTEELGGLHPSRLAAVEALAEAPALLVTGYGGLDPDVYGPLMTVAAQTPTTWATKVADDVVRRDCARLGVDLVEGDPAGLATSALRGLLEEPDLPAVEPRPGWRSWSDRFDSWATKLGARHPRSKFALAWAWLLADAGHRDLAVALLRHVVERHPSTEARLRLADVLYDRSRGGDRDAALSLYRSLALDGGCAWPTRAHCVLRLGGVARSRAVRRPGWRTVPYLVAAVSAPAIVLARGGAGEEVASAHAVLGQTVLRAAEAAAVTAPGARRMLVPPLRWAAAECGRAAATTVNGNRRALASSHRFLALGLAAFCSGRRPDSAWDDALRSLAESYRHAGDLPGAGNCAAARAVLAAADGDAAAARRHLDAAAVAYAEGRPDGELIPSGAALLARLGALLADAIAEPPPTHTKAQDVAALALPRPMTQG